jgi:hypothetical protein
MADTLRIKRRIGGAAGAPSALKSGELAWNDAGSGALYIGRGDDGSGNATTILQIAPAAAGSVTISATPPASPSPGNLWWDTIGGQLYIYFDDGNSQQWTIAVNAPVSGINEAPLDGKSYLRSNAAWTSQIKGVTDASSAPVGSVGEFVESYRNDWPVAASSSWGVLAGLSLSAGDWDVSAHVIFYTPNGTSGNCVMQMEVTTAGAPSGLLPNWTAGAFYSVSAYWPLHIGPLRFSSAGAMSPALWIWQNSTVTTQVNCHMIARRMR